METRLDIKTLFENKEFKISDNDGIFLIEFRFVSIFFNKWGFDEFVGGKKIVCLYKCDTYLGSFVLPGECLADIMALDIPIRA